MTRRRRRCLLLATALAAGTITAVVALNANRASRPPIAFQEQSLRLRLPAVVALSVNGGGTRLFGSTWPPKRRRGGLAPDAAERLARDLAAAAEAAGAIPTRITVLHPRGFAIAMTLRVRHPAQFLRERIGEVASVRGLGATDGTLFSVRDREDRFAAAVATARTRAMIAQTSRTRPELAGCLVRIGGGPSHPPPPCPSD